MAPLSPAALILLALLAALLVGALVLDLRSRIIPNELNAAVAVLAVPWWFAIALSPEAIAWQVAAALGVLILFALCFALGMMGGGDVKLLAALALWLPLGAVADLLLWTALAGGVLTLVMIGRRPAGRGLGEIEVPYGVAIVGAAFLVVANDILTTAAA